jgi:probable selenium-dependent hydroxylase accessory protein YqeC
VLETTETDHPDIRRNDAAGTLLQALHATKGIVCLTGAGGKKTAMYLLARLHPGKVGLTATVHMQRFRRQLLDEVIIDTGEALHQAVTAATGRVIGFASPCDDSYRHSGLPPAEITRLHKDAGLDLCLVKADGARQKLIKAPAPYEPVLPDHFATLIAIVSASVIGQPLTPKIAHRPELIATCCSLESGELIAPKHIARLLSRPDGIIKQTGAGAIVPLINMVDNQDRLGPARQAARMALDATDQFDRVVLASLKHGALVEVVER